MKLKPYPKYKDSGIEWIGEIPEGWNVRKIKHLTFNLDGKRIPVSADEREEGEIPYYGATGILDHIKDYIFNETLLLIGEDGAPFFEANKNVAYIIEGKSWVNNHTHVLRVNKNININWLCNFLNVYDYSSCIKGSTRDKLNQDQLSNMFVVKPSTEEQTAIASFLDKKTSQINKIIGKNQKLIELLKEKRTALINHAVTKGLDPDAKMKDSGIDWIGEIPEGWGVRKLKYIIKPTGLIRGPFGSSIKMEYFVNRGYKVYEQKNAIKRNPYIGTSYIDKDKYNELIRFSVRKDDIIMSCSGTIGKIVKLPSDHEPGIINQALLIIRLIDAVNLRFFEYIFESELAQKQIVDISMGGAMKNLISMDIFKNIKLILPHSHDQTAIASFLDKKTSQLDKTIQKIQSKIKLLEEYKKSLIHHVVTGKIDVRGVI
jgi:type I restriction enzyme S subunit